MIVLNLDLDYFLIWALPRGAGPGSSLQSFSTKVEKGFPLRSLTHLNAVPLSQKLPQFSYIIYNKTMAKSKLSDSEQVAEFIGKLEKPVAEAVDLIRQIFLSIDGISEQIKWNSPSFYYNGEMKPFDPKEYKRDIAVTNLHRGRLMLVFPTGARISDSTGLLEGTYTDGRRMVNFKDVEDVKAKEDSLRNVIIDWLSKVEQ